MNWEPLPLDLSCSGISGMPLAEMAHLASDGTVTTGYWRCTPGRFTWHYDVNETIVLISGTAIIRGRLCSAGAVISFKRGSAAVWDVLDTVTKLYVIQKQMPLWRRILRRFL